MIKKIKCFWWLPKCKYLNRVLILSLIGFISYEFSKEWPELIPHVDIPYRIFSQLSLSVIGSYIFYVIVVYSPSKKIQRLHITDFSAAINRYREIYFKEFNTENLSFFYSLLEKIGPDLLQSEIATKINFDDKEKKYHALFSAVMTFEKDLGIYLEKFTSNYLSENKEIIKQIRIIHNSNEIIQHYRSTNLLRRNTKDSFEKNFISYCIFGELPSSDGSFKVKDSFKTHMKNCERLLEILNICYD